MSNEGYRIVIKADKIPEGEDERRFNAPVTNEVAIVIVGQESHDRHDIIARVFRQKVIKLIMQGFTRLNIFTRHKPCLLLNKK